MSPDYCDACATTSDVARAFFGCALCARCFRWVSSREDVVSAGRDYGTHSRVYVEAARACDPEGQIASAIEDLKAARSRLEDAIAEAVAALRDERY